MVFDYLRKNTDEVTTHSIEADIFKARTGLKDLNRNVWQSKLNYAQQLANTTLIEQQEVALKVIETTKTASLLEVGTTIESKVLKLQKAGEQAKALVDSNAQIAKAIILQARELAKLNGETAQDLAGIETEANIQIAILNQTAIQQTNIVAQALNDSINEIYNNNNNNNNGVFHNVTANYFFGDGRYLTNLPVTNLSLNNTQFTTSTNIWSLDLTWLYNYISNLFYTKGEIDQKLNNISLTPGPQGIQGIPGINGTNGINGVNGTNGASYNQVLNITSNVTFNKVNATNGFFTYLGSLTDRITKLFVQEIDIEKSIKIGYTAQGVCNASTEGTIIYDNAGNKREFYGCRQKSVGVYEWATLS